MSEYLSCDDLGGWWTVWVASCQCFSFINGNLVLLSAGWIEVNVYMCMMSVCMLAYCQLCFLCIFEIVLLIFRWTVWFKFNRMGRPCDNKCSEAVLSWTSWTGHLTWVIWEILESKWYIALVTAARFFYAYFRQPLVFIAHQHIDVRYDIANLSVCLSVCDVPVLDKKKLNILS